MRISTLLIIVCASPFLTMASEDRNPLRFGFEYNYYPAGHIFSLYTETTGAKHSFNTRAGINIARRKDFSGLNDNEQGWGPGISAGYRYYLDPGHSGLHFGLRSDLWLLSINWEDRDHIPDKGRTTILVLQPVAELAYQFKLSNGLNISTAVVNGFEINMISNGKDVGQGWITLLQLRIGKIF